jgi:hypothetical protein
VFSPEFLTIVSAPCFYCGVSGDCHQTFPYWPDPTPQTPNMSRLISTAMKESHWMIDLNMIFHLGTRTLSRRGKRTCQRTACQVCLASRLPCAAIVEKSVCPADFLGNHSACLSTTVIHPYHEPVDIFLSKEPNRSLASTVSFNYGVPQLCLNLLITVKPPLYSSITPKRTLKGSVSWDF